MVKAIDVVKYEELEMGGDEGKKSVVKTKKDETKVQSC